MHLGIRPRYSNVTEHYSSGSGPREARQVRTLLVPALLLVCG